MESGDDEVDKDYPVGIVGQLNLYLYSPSSDCELKIKVVGLNRPLSIKKNTNPQSLVAALGQTLPSEIDDWRFMTRAEIREYEENE